MKTSVKNTAKSFGVSTVQAIAKPLHIAGQLVTNVAQVMTDGVALGEGYLVSKIDKSQEAEVVASARVEYTKAKFTETAFALQMVNARLQQSIDDSKEKIKDAKNKIAEKFSKPEPQHMVVEGKFRVKEMKTQPAV